MPKHSVRFLIVSVQDTVCIEAEGNIEMIACEKVAAWQDRIKRGRNESNSSSEPAMAHARNW